LRREMLGTQSPRRRGPHVRRGGFGPIDARTPRRAAANGYRVLQGMKASASACAPEHAGGRGAPICYRPGPVPELPDLEVYVGALKERVVGHVLESIELRSPFVLRTVVPSYRDAVGRRVEDVGR